MRRTRLFLAIVTIAATSVSLSCDSDPLGFRFADVFGTVRDADTGSRLRGVLVKIGRATDRTNSQGEYLISSKRGHRTIRATKEGYEPFSKRIDVELFASGGNKHNFRMTKL